MCDTAGPNTANLASVLRELTAREPIFHRPELGTTRAHFDAMMAPDFREIGASGTPYSREEVLNILEQRHATPHTDIWETSDFRCQLLAPDLYLLTYTLLQNHVRLTRRSTIWRRSPVGWQIVFHQGTIVAPVR